MAQVALAFLWHQHQPYYPDDVAGENPMPWVRLHGVKDYWGMAVHLLEFPEMRCTINLVPSLLYQLQGYTERGATDRPLSASRNPADGLSEDDSLYLLDNFFMANAQTMIRPFPRYFDLLQRRAAGRNTAKEALRRFNHRDFRDLQVWFNLAWIHPLAIERDEGLRELVKKGRYFTEADKQVVLDKHLQILREIIPLHKELMDRGQVELTTTPYFHPIFPLLLDKKLAREAMPNVKLPRYTGGYPDDAALHLRRAVDQHTALFGKAPTGMWPAEGSVCQAMIPLIAQHGIRWMATDEEVLSHSLESVGRDEHGHVHNPEQFYRPYHAREGEHGLNVVFRDHNLSDMVGFHYQRSQPVEAAEDFIHHLAAISHAVRSEATALVPVILDGENCWEHYTDGGVPFLRALYERCTKQPFIRPVKIGEYLEQTPPRDTLPRLFAGSWIHHNFAIWIGHEEDNTAWDALHRAREYLLSAERGARSAEQGRSALDKAWQEIYIAEGSDWFWWYGDDHSSAQDDLFDYLFRKHLQNVYLLLGDTPPAELGRPFTRKGQKAFHTLPRSLLDVKVDGRQTFFEWVSAGQYVCQNERGTMAMTTHGPIQELRFGFSLRNLFLRIEFDKPARIALSAFDLLRVVFTEPSGWELHVAKPASLGQTVTMLVDGEPRASESVAVGIDRIAEISVPFDILGVKSDQPIHFYVDLMENKQSRDRAPREGTVNLVCPSPDFEQIMWDV